MQQMYLIMVLGCTTTLCGKGPTFQKNIAHSSGLKSKPSKKLAEAAAELTLPYASLYFLLGYFSVL
jgi:hypothetical protein